MADQFTDLLDQVDTALIFNNLTKFENFLACIALFRDLDKLVLDSEHNAATIRAKMGFVSDHLLPQQLRFIAKARKVRQKSLYVELLKDLRAARALKFIGLQKNKTELEALAQRFVLSYESRRVTGLSRIKSVVVDPVHLKNLVAYELKEKIKEITHAFLFAQFTPNPPPADLKSCVEGVFELVKAHLRLSTFPFSEFAESVIARLKALNEQIKAALPRLQFSSDPDYPDSTARDFEAKIVDLVRKNVAVSENNKLFIKSLVSKVEMEEEALVSQRLNVTQIRNFLQNMAILMNNLLKEMSIHLKEVIDLSSNLLVLPKIFYAMLEVISAFQDYVQVFPKEFRPNYHFLYLNAAGEANFLAFWGQIKSRINTDATLTLIAQLRTKLYQAHVQSLLELVRQKSEFFCILNFEAIDALETLVHPEKVFSVVHHPSKLVEVRSQGDVFSFYKTPNVEYFFGYCLHAIAAITRHPDIKPHFQELLYGVIDSALSDFSTEGTSQVIIENCLALGVVQRVFTNLITKSFLPNHEQNMSLGAKFESKFGEVRSVLDNLIKDQLTIPFLTYKQRIEEDFLKGEPFVSPSPHLFALSASVTASFLRLKAVKDLSFQNKLKAFLTNTNTRLALDTLNSHNKLFRNRASINCEIDLLKAMIASLSDRNP